MSDETIQLLIANLPSILVAFGTLATSLIGAVIAIFTFRRAGRAETAAVTATVMAEASVEQSKLNTVKIEEASGQIETVRLDVNDKMQQFIEVTKTSAKAEGKLEEKDEQAVRDAIPTEVVEAPEV